MNTQCPSLPAVGIGRRRATPSEDDYFVGVPDISPDISMLPRKLGTP